MSLLFKNCSKTKLSQPITQPCHNMFKWDEVQSLFPAAHRLDRSPANTLDLSDTCACSPLCQPVTGDVFRHAKNATVILLQIKLTGQIGTWHIFYYCGSCIQLVFSRKHKVGQIICLVKSFKLVPARVKKKSFTSA